MKCKESLLSWNGISLRQSGASANNPQQEKEEKRNSIKLNGGPTRPIQLMNLFYWREKKRRENNLRKKEALLRSNNQHFFF